MIENIKQYQQDNVIKFYETKQYFKLNQQEQTEKYLQNNKKNSVDSLIFDQIANLNWKERLKLHDKIIYSRKPKDITTQFQKRTPSQIGKRIEEIKQNMKTDVQDYENLRQNFIKDTTLFANFSSKFYNNSILDQVNKKTNDKELLLTDYDTISKNDLKYIKQNSRKLHIKHRKTFLSNFLQSKIKNKRDQEKKPPINQILDDMVNYNTKNNQEQQQMQEIIDEFQKSIQNVKQENPKLNAQETQFIQYVYFGDERQIKNSTEKQPSLVNLRCFQHKTPLHITVIKNLPQVFQYLLENGAELDSKDIYNRTPFMLAQKFNRTEILTIIKNYRKYNLDQN